MTHTLSLDEVAALSDVAEKAKGVWAAAVDRPTGGYTVPRVRMEALRDALHALDCVRQNSGG